MRMRSITALNTTESLRWPAVMTRATGRHPRGAGGEVLHRRPAPPPPPDAVDPLPVVQTLAAPPRHRTVRQQRLEQRPLRIGYIVTIDHTDDLPDPTSIIRQTRPSGFCVRKIRGGPS